MEHLGPMGAALFFGFAQNLSIAGEKPTNYFRNSKSLSTSSTIRIDHFSPGCVLRKIIGTKSEREKLRQNEIRKEMGPPSKRRGAISFLRIIS